MNLTLTSGRVRLARINPPATLGGIVLPESIRDDYNTGGVKLYRVVQTGPGWRHKSGKIIPFEFKAGDRVFCHSYTSGPTDLPDGTHIITHDQIIAILPTHAA